MYNYDKDRNLILKTVFFQYGLEYSIHDLLLAKEQHKNLYPHLDDSEFYVVIDDISESVNFEFWITPTVEELREIEEINKLIN